MRWSSLTPAERAAVRQVLANAERESAVRAAKESTLIDDLLARTHEKQRAFATDRSPLVAACCSGRAGKSFGLGVAYSVTALQVPNGLSLYLAESVGKCRELLWEGAIARLSVEHGLRAKLYSPQGLTYIIFPNGHRIWLGSYANVAEIEKYRGPAYHGLVGIDEAQTPTALLYRLVYEVLQPRCADHRTPIVLAGTPGPVSAGLFYEATSGALPGWSSHHWTLLDNTHFPRWSGNPDWQLEAVEFLAQVRQTNGWEETTPAYQREYLGQWVQDFGNLVFPFDYSKNGWNGDFPDGQVVTVIGVDLATTGTTAFVVASMVRGHPETYIRHAESHVNIDLPRVSAIAEKLRQQHSAIKVVVDVGGLGKAFVDDMRSRYRIPAEPAEKQGKAGFAYAMAGDLRSGAVKVLCRHCRPLLDEWAGLVWDDDRKGWGDLLPDHVSDAALYAWRALRPLYKPIEEEPLPGTREWDSREAARAKAAAIERVRKSLQLGRRRH